MSLSIVTADTREGDVLSLNSQSPRKNYFLNLNLLQCRSSNQIKLSTKLQQVEPNVCMVCLISSV